MRVELLGPSEVMELRARPLTYVRPAHAGDAPPAGYNNFTRARTLPRGTDFAAAAAAVMTWQVHTRSGLRVRASSADVERDSVVILSAGIGPARLQIPCRVVEVVDEHDRQGFSYGTLLGHPESGEETFLVQHQHDGSVTFTISAFSRPASVLARLGGPLTTQLQRRMTRRYLDSLG